jgi:GNAT superfamily N-acetyltransferase
MPKRNRGRKIVSVLAPGVIFRLLDGPKAIARGDGDLLALPADSGPGDGEVAAQEYARQFRVWRRQPGFALAEAMHGGFVVGYAAGLPLRPSSSWWRDVTTRLPEAVSTEHPGRTFAVMTLVVRAAWRRQGIGTQLHTLLLAGRPEERATLTAGPQAAAQAALRAWGWSKVARTRAANSGLRDIYLLSPLPNVPFRSSLDSRPGLPLTPGPPMAATASGHRPAG